jgi:anti-sigma regulatory factor (Ser/Thr protein kinase)
MPYHRCASCGLTSYSAATYSGASACPSCSATLGEATRFFLAPGSARSISRFLTSGVEAPAEARRALVGLPLPQDTRDQLALVVSELVTNAVVHAGLAPQDAVRLRVTLQQRCVRVEVRDGGRGYDPVPYEASNPPTAGGRGLMIVADVSDAWGVERHADGCTVWCEVLVGEAAPVIEHPSVGAYVRELALEMSGVQARGAE